MLCIVGKLNGKLSFSGGFCNHPVSSGSEKDWLCMFGGEKIDHIFFVFLFRAQALHEMVQQKVVTLP